MFSVNYCGRDSPLKDIDLDLCPSKRPLILEKIKQERGRKFKADIDELSRKHLGCTLIATFGTEGTKSAILTACRGYRSEEYMDGIDSDTAQYMSSLIPSERGFLWPLSDVVNGNVEKDRKPIKLFINETSKYPGLLDIMLGIEGLINKRSSHASGVIMFDEDPYEFGCFMKTPKGEVITQWDLHQCEYVGMTKYDFLVTEVQDKLAQTIALLQHDEVIEPELTLREAYNKYLHPEVLPLDDEKVWKAIQNNEVLNVFQFDSDVGSQAAKKIKPSNIWELADANGLMRLMTAEKGQETPMEKYIRFKNNIGLWYTEMACAGLTVEQQTTLEPYFKSSYGVPPSQEQLMKMLMDNKICNFSLAEANMARRIVGKKQMSKIPELKEMVLSRAATNELGNYVWKCGIGPQMGYSFSIIHALAYSFIGFQTAYVATHWNPIYWNTACLIVNSGALEDEIIEYEFDEEEVLRRRERTTDYAKMAKAIGDITSRGIKVSLININKSDIIFVPDIENNQILFGMKGVNKVETEVINKIIENRPYVSFKDFMNKCPLNKTVMISLIKAGAFDNLEKEWAEELNVDVRLLIMVYYLSIVSEPKKKLNLQNFNGLMSKDLIPPELEFHKRLFNFNKFLKTRKARSYYVFEENSLKFYSDNFNLDNLELVEGHTVIKQTTWDKIYSNQMDEVRNWLKNNQEEVLKQYNYMLFLDYWEKYATGSISAWEMESVCFYYHDHELANVNTQKYGISDFFTLPSEPSVELFFKRGNNQIPIYRLNKIIGTVLCKNDVKSTVTLLTTTGVVTVKFTKDYFAMYNRQISEVQPDGSKKVIEQGWMKRGNKLMIMGFRRDDMFIAKKYANSSGHILYKITSIDDTTGDITITHDRKVASNALS